MSIGKNLSAWLSPTYLGLFTIIVDVYELFFFVNNSRNVDFAWSNCASLSLVLLPGSTEECFLGFEGLRHTLVSTGLKELVLQSSANGFEPHVNFALV